MFDFDNRRGTSSVGETAIYLFGFTCGDVLAAAPLAEAHCPLSQLLFRDIVAVFGEVALEEWTGPVAESHLQDLTWVGPRACLHEKVIERLMRASAVFPARFATLFSSLGQLKKLMEMHHEVILTFLKSVAGKEEWAVRVFVDRAKAEESLFAALAHSQDVAGSASTGLDYLRERRLRVEVARKARSWIHSTGQAIPAELEPHVVASRSLKTLTKEASGRDTEMVFNWAFLLARETREEFRARVDEIGAPYATQGLLLESSGPWPPYSFCPSLDAGLSGTDEAGAES